MVNEETSKANESVQEETATPTNPNQNAGLTATLERAEQVLAGLQQETARLEKLKADRLLGGVTNSGDGEAPKKELSPEEYAKAALANKL